MNKKISMRLHSTLMFIVYCFVIVGFTGCQSKEKQYQSALEMIEKGNYSEARDIFVKLNDFNDSADMIKECDYLLARDMLLTRDFNGAKSLFESIRGYKDVDTTLASMKSPISGVSDYTYFYGLMFVERISDGNYRSQLKDEIKNATLAKYNDKDYIYSNVAVGAELVPFLKNLDCTKEAFSEIKEITGSESNDKEFAKCLLSYYYIVFDEAYGKGVENNDYSSEYGFNVFFGGDPDLSSFINRSHNLFYTSTNLNSFEELAEIADWTILSGGTTNLNDDIKEILR